MESKLEQGLIYAPRASLTERVYSLVDLSGLSSVALYNNCPEYDKHVRETWREDSDEKLGDHINYEVWLKRIGYKKGRREQLSNAHIIISPPSSGNGY